MSSTFKRVGSLTFNQQEGTIKHAITGEDLAKYIVKLAIPIHLLAKSVTVAIDSTGVKEACGHCRILSEMYKHLDSAFLEANAETPSATDATVNVELYNVTDAEVVASLSFAGVGGYKVSSDIASSIKALAGKVVCGRINVATASATAGATQVFDSVVLLLIYNLTK